MVTLTLTTNAAFFGVDMRAMFPAAGQAFSTFHGGVPAATVVAQFPLTSPSGVTYGPVSRIQGPAISLIGSSSINRVSVLHGDAFNNGNIVFVATRSEPVPLALGVVNQAFAAAIGLFLSGNDTLDGSSTGDWLIGADGDDAIRGFGGFDTLSGGAGTNTLDGGAGSDTAEYGWNTQGVVADLSAGTASGWGGSDTLVSIEVLVGGAGADSLAGNGDGNALLGQGGDDRLFGRAGEDHLDGGDGDDLLAGRSAASEAGLDALVGGAGSDSAVFDWVPAGSVLAVRLGDGTAFVDGSLVATLQGVENIRVRSDAMARLLGDAGANSFAAGAGDDTLSGEGGDDLLSGGTGRNTLDGGAGTDMADYSWAAGPVLVDLRGGFATGPGGLADALVSLEGARGGAGDDILGGVAGGGSLDGGDGDDAVFAYAGQSALGGDGDDTLYADGADVVLRGGAGRNLYAITDPSQSIFVTRGATEIALVFTDGWNVAPSGISAAYLSGGARLVLGAELADTLVANPAASAGSALVGRGGDDALWGAGFADTLDGGRGNDALRAGAGDDTLDGGAGDDQLVGGPGADLFQFGLSGWGYDQVFDFDAAAGDRLDFRFSGVLAFAQLTVWSAGGNTALIAPGGSRVDLYGVAAVSAADMIFF
jgi:Ca2+-binding RTX toxin-like protein